jgi:nucleoside-diphosphate-sugar epimerase
MAEAQKHLVIFGSGYVGGAVARQALARGWRVTALTRNPSTAAALRAAGMQVIVGDLAGTDWHTRIEACDFVLNAVSSGGGGVEAYRHSYVAGMRSIVEWAGVRGSIRALVYTSSTSVYAQGDGVVVTENLPAEPTTERGQLLREAERIAQGGAGSASGRGYRRAVILRLAGIYGPERAHLVDQVRSGVVAGVGGHRLNLAHRDDICRAVWAAFQGPADAGDAIFNVADDAPAPKAEVVRWLARRLGLPEPVFSGTPAGSRERVTPDRIISNARLKRVLAWTPEFPSFREGYENILSRTAD